MATSYPMPGSSDVATWVYDGENHQYLISINGQLWREISNQEMIEANKTPKQYIDETFEAWKHGIKFTPDTTIKPTETHMVTIGHEVPLSRAEFAAMSQDGPDVDEGTWVPWSLLIMSALIFFGFGVVVGWVFL